MKTCSKPRNLPSKPPLADNTTLVCEGVEQGTHLLASRRDASLKKPETVKCFKGLPRNTRFQSLLPRNFFIILIDCKHSSSQLEHPSLDAFVDGLLVDLL